MNDNPIGIFDSGVGGLSVFSELIKLLPYENYVYYGDTANLPYGDKSKAQLLEIASGIFDFFAKQNAKAVVMACNTTSALIYEDVKSKYDFKIYPLVQTVSKDIASFNPKSIGVFATNATINSHAYKIGITRYNPKIEVYEHACPEWVPIVENGLLDEESSFKTVKADLDVIFKNSPEKIILGCTHYPYLLKILSKCAKTDIFINPAVYFAKNIYEDLKSTDMLNDLSQGSEKFYVSGDIEKFVSASRIFYDVSNKDIKSHVIA